MSRTQSDTSRLAFDKIMAPGARNNHYRKILSALQVIENGTSWELATQAGMKPDQVWKRIPELIASEIVFDTGLRRNSPDGNKAMVYALVSEKEKYKDVPKPERVLKSDMTAADFANLLIAKNSKAKFVQPELDLK